MTDFKLNRRTLLKASAVAGVSALSTQNLAGAVLRKPARGGTKVLVHLFLHGGADALSLVAPVNDNTYRTVLRPTLRVGAPGEGTALDGLPMDTTFAMHPDMAPLHALFTPNAGKLAVIHAAGYTPASRSHFSSTDLVHFANNSGTTAGGWLNRFAQVTSSGPSDATVRLMSVGNNAVPKIIKGDYPSFAVDSTSALAFQSSGTDIETYYRSMIQQSSSLSQNPTLNGVRKGCNDAFELIDHFTTINPNNYAPASTYPPDELGTQLAEIAEVIKGDLGVQAFFTVSHGWDHHSNLWNNVSNKANSFAPGLAAFVADLGPLMNDVVVVVQSEFGREALENASAGVDHGMGGTMFVIGGTSQGGQVHGVWPGVDIGSLSSGRFLAPANDYRDVFSDVLSSHFGLSPAELNFVFPGHTHTPLGIM